MHDDLTPAEALAHPDRRVRRAAQRQLQRLAGTWDTWVEQQLGGQQAPPWRVRDPRLLAAMAMRAEGQRMARYLATVAPSLYVPEVAQ